MEKKLTILICTVTDRKEKLDRMMRLLDMQRCDDLGILTLEDNREMLIGTKRNLLVKQAADAGSKYICFVDDDDLVSHDYVPRMMTAIIESPDVVTIQGMMTVNGDSRTSKPFYHGLKYPKPTMDLAAFYQPPNHLDAVRTELAVDTPFPDKNFAEDQAYAAKLYPKLKSEVHLDAFVYLYDFYHKNPRRVRNAV